MRKLLLAFATALLIPGMLGAAMPGVYSGMPSGMADSPASFSFLSGPHPGNGELCGAFTPENELVPVAQEAIWGAIESLYVMG